MSRKDVIELEDCLAATAGGLPDDSGGDPSRFFTELLPYLHSVHGRAKAEVAKLGMTEIVDRAVEECSVLVKQGQQKKAQDLLFEACGALREKSGTWDRMRRIYTASNDPQGS